MLLLFFFFFFFGAPRTEQTGPGHYYSIDMWELDEKRCGFLCVVLVVGEFEEEGKWIVCLCFCLRLRVCVGEGSVRQ